MGCTTSKLPSELQLSPRPTLDVKGPLSPIQEEAESASPVASTDFEIDNLINLYETGRLDEAPDTGSPVGAIDEKYQCEHDCGFVGTYAEVALHEDGCPARKPGGAPRNLGSPPPDGKASTSTTPKYAAAPEADDMEQFMSSILEEVDSSKIDASSRVAAMAV